MARKGYRFIAPVQQVGDSHLAVNNITDVSVPKVVPPESHLVKKGRRRTWRAGRTWAAAIAVVILAGAAWLYFRRSVGLPPMTLRRLTSYPGKEKDPALSPDGKRLAFAWARETGDNFDIYVQSIGPAGELPLTSEHARPLTTDLAPDLSPAWSPADFTWLLFASRQRAVPSM